MPPRHEANRRATGRPPRPTPRRILRALIAPVTDERPEGVTALRYHFPRTWLLSMGQDLLLNRPRDFRADCALAVRSLPRPPLVEGLAHVPPSGSFLLVANHYQRRDLWIGWAGALLCDALWQARPDLACSWVTEDRAVLDGASILWTRPLFARVAHVWGMVLVTPPEALDANAEHARRHALRACLRALRPVDAHPVCLCIMPEGIGGSTCGLSLAAPGSGRSMLALATMADVPLLPAAVFEEQNGALHARFGPAWQPSPPTNLARDTLDAWMSDDLMCRIAALLPPSQQGAYRALVAEDGRASR